MEEGPSNLPLDPGPVSWGLVGSSETFGLSGLVAVVPDMSLDGQGRAQVLEYILFDWVEVWENA